MTEKVFVIGVEGTGTYKVAGALETLGYHLGGDLDAGAPQALPLTRVKLADAARPMVLRADAFAGNPWPLIYREMDHAFPGSKFILTRRDPANWFEAVKDRTSGWADPYRALLLGGGEGPLDATKCILRYQHHIDGVLTHFAGRPNDLLVTDLNGWTWDALCGFLHKPVPATPLPQARKSNADGATPIKALGRAVQGLLRRDA
jgi:hypothetical protein